MIGKKIGANLYFHKSVLKNMPPRIKAAVAKAKKRINKKTPFNVVKIGKEHVSFLYYKRFMTDSFPELKSSVTVKNDNGRVMIRDYGGVNPPILHRKELLLPKTHPNYAKFVSVTLAAEKAGLFKDTKRIGRKQFWEKISKP